MNNHYRLNPSYYSTHSVIQRLIGKNKTVLDSGCSDGYMATIADKSNKIYGLDNSKPSIKNAKKKLNDVALYDLNKLKKLPWKIKFDVIIFADVLEHLYDPKKTLVYFKKNYLKKKGRIIISLPNIANWQIRANLILGRFNYTDAGIMDRTHLHFYTINTANKLVVESGLEMVKEVYGSSVFGPLIKLIPTTASLLATSIVLECKNEK